jgi:sarcosine oxidase subunit alpha
MDDGVVARLDEDTFLCHTTTGGADRIHAHMEEWLQPNGGTGRSTPPT